MREHSSSNGWIDGDACFGFVYGENSGPIDRYMTYDFFTLPSEGRVIVPAPWEAPDERGNWVPAQAPAVLTYLDRELRARGWRREGRSWTASEVTYRKDGVLLVVGAQLNIGDPYKRDPYYRVAVVPEFA